MSEIASSPNEELKSLMKKKTEEKSVSSFFKNVTGEITFQG